MRENCFIAWNNGPYSRVTLISLLPILHFSEIARGRHGPPNRTTYASSLHECRVPNTLPWYRMLQRSETGEGGGGGYVVVERDSFAIRVHIGVLTNAENQYFVRFTTYRAACIYINRSSRLIFVNFGYSELKIYKFMILYFLRIFVAKLIFNLVVNFGRECNKEYSVRYDYVRDVRMSQ